MPDDSVALFQLIYSVPDRVRRWIYAVDQVILIMLTGSLLTLLSACTTPQHRLDQLANGWGWQRLTLDGDPFQHRAYRNSIPLDTVVHVYLDGDGSPWRNGRFMADPTPRRPLVLQLMAQDQQASLYLGRPCYHGNQHDPGCSPWLWTAARYSPIVIDSLVAALHTVLREHPNTAVVLIGYSGGGALAMLMAERLPQIRLIVTIAANLDTTAWVEHHGYSPLLGSLNPAKRPPLALPQWHLLGEQDTEVPPVLNAAVIERQPCAHSELIAGFTHRCCWLDYWPQVLSKLTDDRFHCSE